MFIADDIACANIDDWCNLPLGEPVGVCTTPDGRYVNVYEGVPDAVARHDALFELTH